MTSTLLISLLPSPLLHRWLQIRCDFVVTLASPEPAHVPGGHMLLPHLSSSTIMCRFHCLLLLLLPAKVVAISLNWACRWLHRTLLLSFLACDSMR